MSDKESIDKIKKYCHSSYVEGVIMGMQTIIKLQKQSTEMFERCLVEYIKDTEDDRIIK